MYKYNFDEVIDRHNTFSDKWDILDDKDVIIYEAVNFMASQGVYGYGFVPDAYYEAIVSFHKRHYNEDLKKDWIIPTPAVVPAISAILQAITLPGDEVITQTPAYNCFFSCIKNSGCVLVENKIICKDSKFTLA